MSDGLLPTQREPAGLVVQLLIEQRAEIASARRTIEELPDRMDERYHRKELVESRFSALADRIDSADRERAEARTTATNLRGGLVIAVVAQILAVAAVLTFPH